MNAVNPTMTAVELGALLGISDRAVREMAKAGHIVVIALRFPCEALFSNCPQAFCSKQNCSRADT